jgi:hypothetical protein
VAEPIQNEAAADRCARLTAFRESGVLRSSREWRELSARWVCWQSGITDPPGELVAELAAISGEGARRKRLDELRLEELRKVTAFPRLALALERETAAALFDLWRGRICKRCRDE